MSLSYSIRLLLLCFASFFLVHAVAGAAVRLALNSILRFADRLNASTAAQFLLAVRFLPTGIAIASVLGLCAPSYLRFEENLVVERVGPACLVLGALGFLVCLAALDKGLHSATSCLEFSGLCRASGQTIRLQGKPAELLVIPGARPFLAQSGIFRPRIVISQSLLREFSPPELAAALSHERAHWTSRDNLKRLVLAFLPDILPLVPTFKPLERHWAKFAERAADDCVLAVGTEQGISLASALLRLARLGSAPNLHGWAPFATSPLGGGDDLRGRVDRLLAPKQPTARLVGSAPALIGAGAFLTAFLVAFLAWPATLSPLHDLLERFLH